MSTAKFCIQPSRPPSPTTALPLSPTEDETVPLEIVFSFNTAGAFGPMLPTSKSYLKHLIRCLDSDLFQKIFSLNTSSATRLAIFAHGIHDKLKAPKYGLQYVDLTDDVTELCRFVDRASPLSWGATSHCYELVLRKARSLSWTPGSRRALIVVGCTRPHYGYHPDSEELIHWRLEARCLAQMGIPVYAVEVKIQNVGHEFYRSVAEITEGCHVMLEQCTKMADVITAIVSHIVGPESLEDFEQEVIDRKHDYYTADIARVFATLRQHEDTMTSLSGTSSPPTPQGSDFGDDVNDVDVNGDDVGLSAQGECPEERPGLKRRFSMRLKQKSLAVKTEQSLENPADTSNEPRALKRKRQPTSSLATAKKRRNEAAGNGSLTNQQTVSFYLPDEDDEESAQKLITSIPPADPINSRGNISLKKSKTVTLPARRGKGGKCADTVVQNLVDNASTVCSMEGSTPKKRPALRKGVTNAGFWAGEGTGTADNRGGDSLLGGSCSARVYKIEREAPEKREDLLPGAFTLRHLSWSPWKLVISPYCPAEAKHEWEPRLQNDHGGYRRRKVFTETEDSTPALYEIALQPEKTTKKRVVFYKILPELVDATSWESQILARDEVQREISEAVRKKCSVFLRRAPLAQKASRVQDVMQAALHKYDYAWNDVQGFKRPVRHVDFF